jgi:hypothetical protein
VLRVQKLPVVVHVGGFLVAVPPVGALQVPLGTAGVFSV